MTPAQAAKRLGLCTETIRRRIREEDFAPGEVVNFGTPDIPRYRIKLAAIERLERDGIEAFSSA